MGASTNGHVFQTAVSANDPNAPMAIHGIAATPAVTQIAGAGAASAPLIDVTQLGNDGFACAALPPGSLNGVFALIHRGGTNDCEHPVQ